jgi:hypothetical protein
MPYEFALRVWPLSFGIIVTRIEIIELLAFMIMERNVLFPGIATTAANRDEDPTFNIVYNKNHPDESRATRMLSKI